MIFDYLLSIFPVLSCDFRIYKEGYLKTILGSMRLFDFIIFEKMRAVGELNLLIDLKKVSGLPQAAIIHRSFSISRSCC